MTFNILPVAMAAISNVVPPKNFLYIEYSETETIINEIGNEIPKIKFQKSYIGNIQPVSENKMYSELGLDLSSNDYVVYCPELLLSLAEKTLTGRIIWANRTFDIIGNRNWYAQNKFTKCFIRENKSLRSENGDNT